MRQSKARLEFDLPVSICWAANVLNPLQIQLLLNPHLSDNVHLDIS